ncbi:MAG: preprotein translocase subunit SecE [Terriglobales bacterium]
MSVSAATENNSPSRGKVKDLSQRLKSFYVDVRSEMKKVTVPAWKEVQATTIVVLITVAVFGAFFYGCDWILTKIINAIIYHFAH